MSIEHWWIETTRKRLRYSYRSLPNCDFVFHKLKPGLIGEGPVTLWDRVLCYVMAVDLCLQSEACICYKLISKSIIENKTNMSAFCTEYTVCFNGFIIYLFVALVFLNECQNTIEIKVSSKDRRKYSKSSSI
jgi:hypothetical protein